MLGCVRAKHFVRQYYRSFSVAAKLWPKEVEGNVYSINYSLVEDGVVSQGDSFRNGRLNLLLTKAATKAGDNISIPSLNLRNAFAVKEAGDTILHDTFKVAKAVTCELLSSGTDLFVEDASLGTIQDTRVGIRVLTQSPVNALVFRSLMVIC